MEQGAHSKLLGAGLSHDVFERLTVGELDAAAGEVDGEFFGEAMGELLGMGIEIAITV